MKNFLDSIFRVRKFTQQSVTAETARNLMSDPFYLYQLADDLRNGTVHPGTDYYVLWLFVMDRFYKLTNI
ncbi:MAG: hypothetical protein ACP5QA_10395 [Phycisphaerae bacterium]